MLITRVESCSSSKVLGTASPATEPCQRVTLVHAGSVSVRGQARRHRGLPGLTRRQRREDSCWAGYPVVDLNLQANKGNRLFPGSRKGKPWDGQDSSVRPNKAWAARLP